MKSDKQYLKWCAKQKKGIKVVNGSTNLQKAYLKKSKEALRSMEANAKEGIDEWVVSTSYYANLQCRLIIKFIHFSNLH